MQTSENTSIPFQTSINIKENSKTIVLKQIGSLQILSITVFTDKSPDKNDLYNLFELGSAKVQAVHPNFLYYCKTNAKIWRLSHNANTSFPKISYFASNCEFDKFNSSITFHLLKRSGRKPWLNFSKYKSPWQSNSHISLLIYKNLLDTLFLDFIKKQTWMKIYAIALLDRNTNRVSSSITPHVTRSPLLHISSTWHLKVIIIFGMLSEWNIFIVLPFKISYKKPFRMRSNFSNRKLQPLSIMETDIFARLVHIKVGNINQIHLSGNFLSCMWHKFGYNV